MDNALVGHCLNCGAWCYAQSYCDSCSEKEEPDDNRIWCSVCFDEHKDLVGGICKVCRDEELQAHKDGDCWEYCRYCREENTLRGDCK
jgi:hypothetical protein